MSSYYYQTKALLPLHPLILLLYCYMDGLEWKSRRAEEEHEILSIILRWTGVLFGYAV